MIARRPIARPADAGLPLAALIDCVFLLIVYFMLSGTLEQQEADLAFSLPGVVATVAALELPDVPQLQIDASGRAHLNGRALDTPEQPVYRMLAAVLSRYAQGVAAAGGQPQVWIVPQSQAPHWAIVRVMDACALAGISEISFAPLPEDDAL